MDTDNKTPKMWPDIHFQLININNNDYQILLYVDNLEYEYQLILHPIDKYKVFRFDIIKSPSLYYSHIIPRLKDFIINNAEAIQISAIYIMYRGSDDKKYYRMIRDLARYGYFSGTTDSYVNILDERKFIMTYSKNMPSINEYELILSDEWITSGRYYPILATQPLVPPKYEYNHPKT